jgi:hypothetical protein
MQRSRKARLGRLRLQRDDSEWEAVRERRHLRRQANTCAFIRLVMERTGIDPAGSRPFRDIEAGVLEFLDTPALRARDGEIAAARQSDRPALIRGEEPRQWLIDELNRLGEPYRDGQVPDLAQCSFMELLAWAIARDGLDKASAGTPE